MTPDALQARFGSVMSQAGTGLAAADRLCAACVELLGVDGAAISLVHRGATRGTFGSSSDLSRRLDAYQFTCGEGPCLDAVSFGRPVLAPDLADTAEVRWPAFRSTVLDSGVCAVFAFPVRVASQPVGALDLFCRSPGPLAEASLDGGVLAAHMAALPLLDLMGQADDRAAAGVGEDPWSEGEDPWSELESLERVEIYQATGVLIAQLGVSPAEALVRLRARAFATGQTASETAWAILDHRIVLADDPADDLADDPDGDPDTGADSGAGDPGGGP